MLAQFRRKFLRDVSAELLSVASRTSGQPTSVDRLGRSLQDLIGFLSDLHALKIDLFLRQQGLDTTTPAGKAMFQIMGVFAEFERAMIAERVRAGLARARGEGKRLANVGSERGSTVLAGTRSDSWCLVERSGFGVRCR
jgi:hypothetical protein